MRSTRSKGRGRPKNERSPTAKRENPPTEKRRDGRRRAKSTLQSSGIFRRYRTVGKDDECNKSIISRSSLRYIPPESLLISTDSVVRKRWDKESKTDKISYSDIASLYTVTTEFPQSTQGPPKPLELQVSAPSVISYLPPVVREEKPPPSDNDVGAPKKHIIKLQNTVVELAEKVQRQQETLDKLLHSLKNQERRRSPEIVQDRRDVIVEDRREVNTRWSSWATIKKLDLDKFSILCRPCKVSVAITNSDNLNRALETHAMGKRHLAEVGEPQRPRKKRRVTEGKEEWIFVSKRRYTGVIKLYNPKLHYGFIKCPELKSQRIVGFRGSKVTLNVGSTGKRNNEDIFVGGNDYLACCVRLKPGDNVSFNLRKESKEERGKACNLEWIADL